VQYEIFDRMLALRQRKEEAKRKERERIVEMLTAIINRWKKKSRE
jgi:hypothetical protein